MMRRGDAMTNRDAILAGAQFIDRNLTNEIDILTVAQKSGFSLYHFIRTFHGITGYTPYAYLTRRRLTEAAREIVTSDKKIIEIAFDYGFGTHESFTRAFKKEFGISPMKLRQKNNLSRFSLVEAVDARSCHYNSKLNGSEPQLVELDELLFMGHSFFLAEEADTSRIGTMWRHLQHEIADITTRVLPEKFYQLQYWSDRKDYGGLFFMTAVEVNEIAYSPVLVSKIIPPCRYLKFIHNGRADEVGFTYKYIYNRYLPESSYTPAHPFNFEYYGPASTSPDDENSESEIYIPVRF